MFQGFRPETIDFLWGIKFNNQKSWFEAHKKEYLEYLYEPMKALGAAVYAPLQQVPGMALHVSRIYRDARYARGLPYKDSLWLSVRHDQGYWAEAPCLYFDLHPDYYSYGFGVIYPRAEAMQRFREMLDARPDEFLTLVEQVQKEVGLPITGDSYKRRKSCADPRIEPYYSFKNIFCYTEQPIGPELFAPELADRVAKTLADLLPLYQYCQKFAY